MKEKVNRTAVIKKTVRRESPDKLFWEKYHEKIVKLSEAHQPLALIGGEVNHKFNIGNYESDGVSISVTIPCELKNIPQARALVRKWLNDELDIEKKSHGRGKGLE